MLYNIHVWRVIIMLFKYCKKLFCSARESYFALSKDSSLHNVSLLCGWLGALLIYALLFMSVASWWFLLTAPLLIFLFFIGLGRVGMWLNSRAPLSTEKQTTFWLGTLSIALSVSLIFIAAILLLGVVSSPDTELQWAQVESGKFDDWHPVIHTFSLYILAKIWKSDIFVAGCFVVIFSIICAWLYVSLRRYSVSNLAATVLTLLIALFPLNFYSLRVLWKDSAFMITLLAIGVAMMHLYFTRGAWLERWYNQILLAFLLAIPANEIVIPLLLFIYSSGGNIGSTDIGATLLDAGWGPVTAICTAIFALFHWPCSTSILTAYRETRSFWWTVLTVALPCLIGIVLCMVLNGAIILFS